MMHTPVKFHEYIEYGLGFMGWTRLHAPTHTVGPLICADLLHANLNISPIFVKQRPSGIAYFTLDLEFKSKIF